MSDSLSLRGAVDLGALAAQKDARQKADSAPSGVVIDATQANFQAEVIERSMTVPVILDLWAEWCGPCKTLSPILEKLAAEYAGRWVLAKVDVDAEPAISQAFQVQSIPSVFAVIKGQPLPLFQGAVPEAQAKQYIDAVLAEAAKNGVAGTLGDAPAGADTDAQATETPIDPDLEAAGDAMEVADWDGAEAAYRRFLERNPADSEAKVGLASAGMYRRLQDVDPIETLERAEQSPDDIELQLQAADIQAANGYFEDAFSRLIDGVRRTSGDDRGKLRAHLLELFDVAGPFEPSVSKARVALANALF